MKVKGISQRAMNVFVNYQWKGNVRELENTIESIMVVNSPEVIDLPHLPQEIRDFKEKSGDHSHSESGLLSKRWRKRSFSRP